MLIRIISYLRFLRESTNEHGVHSPFVYNLITKGLYVKKTRKQPIHIKIGKTNRKQRKIIKKLFQYFAPQRNILFFKNQKLTGSYDCIIFDNPNLSHFLESVSYAHNDTLFIFKNPHKNKKNYEDWNTLIKNQKVIVSIDLYHLGLIFIRKEQLKQHFVIRS